MTKLSRIDNLDKPLAARAAALAGARFGGPETPGSYLRDRRRAAGLSIAAVAERVPTDHRSRLTIARQLAALEDDQPGDYLPLVRSLKAHRAFAFNLATFAGLALATCSPALGEWDPA